MSDDIESTRAKAIELLKKYYQDVDFEVLPELRSKLQWKNDNKAGFFLGILQEGEESHIRELCSQLMDPAAFKLQETFAQEDQQDTLLEEWFNYYIVPFHMSYHSPGSKCNTPTSSRPPSRSNSVKRMDEASLSQESDLSHWHLKRALERRDVVCLFCWGFEETHAAHIISQKEIPIQIDEATIFHRASLSQKHQVQNGLLLCANCHGRFDKLHRYVDVVDEQLVVKIVKMSEDPESEQYAAWKRDVRNLKSARLTSQEDWANIDQRPAMELNGEMALYFVEQDPSRLPSRQALEFHKRACHIWRLAGGAEEDEDSCSDDDDCGVDPVGLDRKHIREWQDSSATLTMETS